MSHYHCCHGKVALWGLHFHAGTKVDFKAEEAHVKWSKAAKQLDCLVGYINTVFCISQVTSSFYFFRIKEKQLCFYCGHRVFLTNLKSKVAGNPSPKVKTWKIDFMTTLCLCVCVCVSLSIQLIIALYCCVLGGHRSVIGCHNWQAALRDDHTISVSLKTWIHCTRSKHTLGVQPTLMGFTQEEKKHWCLILCEPNVIIFWHAGWIWKYPCHTWHKCYFFFVRI